jgi:hypothetical protein
MSDFLKILEIYQEHKNIITNEAQTRQYLIMPLIKLLGYDINSPAEVISEFTADVADRKGEKLDFAIKINSKIAILIECKHYTNKLLPKDREQLERYFNCREQVDFARIAVFTNGIKWQFFSDSTREGVMDKEPFYIFDLENDSTYQKIWDFSKGKLEVDKILTQAKTRYRVIKMKSFFEKIFNYNEETSPEECRTLMEIIMKCEIDLGTQKMENKIKDYFQPFLVAREEFMEEFVKNYNSTPPKAKTIIIEEDEDPITEEEMEAYLIIKSICTELIEDVQRIELRNRAGKGNSFVVLDNTQRKPIVNIYFAGTQKYILIGKEVEKVPIDKISEIYKHKHKIIETVKSYL